MAENGSKEFGSNKSSISGQFLIDGNKVSWGEFAFFLICAKAFGYWPLCFSFTPNITTPASARTQRGGRSSQVAVSSSISTLTLQSHPTDQAQDRWWQPRRIRGAEENSSGEGRTGWLLPEPIARGVLPHGESPRFFGASLPQFHFPLAPPAAHQAEHLDQMAMFCILKTGPFLIPYLNAAA